MEIDESVFKPRYPPLTLFGIYGLPLAFFGLMCAAANLPGLPLPFWGFVLLLGIITSLAPFFVIRRIFFREQMVIGRYLLPNIYLDYQDLYGIDAAGIHTTHGKIRLGNLQNAKTLQNMVEHWKATRILKENQLQPKQHRRFDLPVRGYGSYAFIWGLLFGIIGIYIVPPSIKLDGRWILGGIFLITYYLYIYYLPRKL